MKTQKILLSCLTLLLLVMLMNSCKKEEKQLVNLWKLTSYSLNGEPQVLDREYTLDLKDDFNYSTGPFLFSDSPGTWALSSDKETLMLYTHTGYTHTLKILKLKNKELWFQEMSGTTSEEFHWEQK